MDAPLAPHPLPPTPLRAIPPVAIRVATMADLPFMDALQKANARAVGYFTTRQFTDYLEQGAVLVAVGATPASPGIHVGARPASPAGWGNGMGVSHRGETGDAGVAPTGDPHCGAAGDAGVAPTGYLISKDRYLKRDELGVIFQLNVAPHARRRLVGAALVRAA